MAIPTERAVNGLVKQLERAVVQYEGLPLPARTSSGALLLPPREAEGVSTRDSLKERFIIAKVDARQAIEMFPPELAGPWRARIDAAQASFRAADARWKSAAAVAAQRALLGGRSASDSEAGSEQGLELPLRHLDPARAGNEALTTTTLALQVRTTERLLEGAVVLAGARDTAVATCEQLEVDREQLGRIDASLDATSSELGVARVLSIRLLKRLYTDRVLLCLSGLVLCGLVGVIIWSIVIQARGGTPSIVPPIQPPPMAPTPTMRAAL